MITVNRTALNNALKLVSQATAKSGALPIYSTVRLDTSTGMLGLVATDGDTSIVAETDVDGILPNPLVVPARLLANIVGSMPGATVNLDQEDGEVKVTSERSKYTLRTMDPADFPRIHQADGDPIILDADMRHKLGSILYAASRDGARPILCGVGLSDGWAACTDSYRLAAVEIGGNLPNTILPAGALGMVLKNSTGDMTLTIDTHRATFRTDAATWTVRLIEGGYPNWRNLIPDSTPHSIVVDREALATAVGRVGLVNAESPVRIEACDEGLRVYVRAQDVGEASEVVAADTDIEDVIAFNGRYLGDLLHHCGDEAKLELGIVDSSKPAFVRGDGAVSLLMAVRTS